MTAGVDRRFGLAETLLRTSLTALPLKQSASASRIEPATIHRARLGDAEAFTSIVEAYYARCLRFARSMLRDPGEAEDIVQETFIRVYRALPRYEERRRFESWLFHILGNCCRNANSSARGRQIASLVDADAADTLAAPTTPETTFDGEWGERVRNALAEVPAHNREVFLLYHVEGFSYEEIERMTGVKRSALKMRVKRATDQLRQALVKRERAYE